MRSILTATILVATLGTGSALGQTSETSLGWYEDNWEATTFPTTDGGQDCSVDSLADNYPDSAGAWVFVFPTFLQFSPNEGLPSNGVGEVSIDDGTAFAMEVLGGQVGFVSDEDDLPLLQAMAQGERMLIEVWPQSAPQNAVQYIYSLNGFREAFLRIAAECQFDPASVLDAGEASTPTDTEGSSLFGRDKG